MCCLSVEVTLPIVTTFAMAFTLRRGCWLILGYMAMRSSAFIIFAIIAELETLVLPASRIPHILIKGTQPKLDGQKPFFLYFTYQFFLVSEIFLLFFCLHLALGLIHAGNEWALPHFEYYLLCHIVTWIIKIVCLLLLDLQHTILLGWYLLFSMIIILEMYFVVVVYSYYVCLLMEDEDKRLEQKSCYAPPPLPDGHINTNKRTCYPKVAS